MVFLSVIIVVYSSLLVVVFHATNFLAPHGALLASSFLLLSFCTYFVFVLLLLYCEWCSFDRVFLSSAFLLLIKVSLVSGSSFLKTGGLPIVFQIQTQTIYLHHKVLQEHIINQEFYSKLSKYDDKSLVVNS